MPIPVYLNYLRWGAVEDVSKTDDFDVSCLADEAMAASLTYALEKTGKETMATFVISVAVSIM